ncbi:MAG: hypothetical protein CMJ74_03195 [Planctomycetaceae bacterium]|nr:hypothetical protein [Planctomycetaceae bacterium]|tara:strand:- start:2171 stop:3832 length:1662 start_codon:yes stop_codon:yes gene_type:complete
MIHTGITLFVSLHSLALAALLAACGAATALGASESGNVIQLASGDDLNAALQKAQPGDQLVLEAGGEFKGPVVLPNKKRSLAEGQSPWITIRSSKLSELPPVGHRVRPENAEQMPVIFTDNTYPAVTAELAAHHFHFVGIEIASRTEKTYDLVRLGYDRKRGSVHATTVDELPFKIVFERCYIHGNPTGSIRTGITMNTREFAVFDSHISEIHDKNADAQALLGFNATGPFKIVNNFLEGAGENVMFGGADPKIDQIVPSDILIERNYFFKPLRWKEGHPDYDRRWVVKNILEFKCAKRANVRGNIFENCWPAGQSGKAILFTPRNQGGKAPWVTVEDVVFENNVLRNVNGFLQIISADGERDRKSKSVKNILIRNNLLLQVAENNDRGIRAFFELDGSDWRKPAENVRIEHNVGLFVPGHGKSLMQIGSSGTVIDGFVFVKNIFSLGSTGVFGRDSTPGTKSLQKFMKQWKFRDNILIGNTRGQTYPPGNVTVPRVKDVGFVDPSVGDFRLSRTSPGQRLLGTDDSPPGVDLERLRAWTDGVDRGVPPGVNP